MMALKKFPIAGGLKELGYNKHTEKLANFNLIPGLHASKSQVVKVYTSSKTHPKLTKGNYE